MSLLLSALLSSLIPVGVEGIKQLIVAKTGGVKPTSVAEQIQLDNAEVERLKAIAALDSPNGIPRQWIIDLRASSRYLAAWACICLGGYFVTVPELVSVGSELISVAFGFLFGTRLTSGFGPKK